MSTAADEFTRLVEIMATLGQLDRHHLHHPSLAETHHNHLASYSYHRPAISWAGSLGGERQRGTPPLAVHEHPPFRLQPHGAPDGAHLADHPLPAGHGWPPSEGTRRAQDAEEHAPHEHRDDPQGAEEYPRVRDTGRQERQAPGKERQDGPCGGQAVVGHTQVYDKQCEPNEYKNHPDGWQDYHRKQSAFRSVGGYAGNDSIVGLKRLYRTSPSLLPASNDLAANAASG